MATGKKTTRTTAAKPAVSGPLAILRRASGRKYATMDEALADLGPAFNFAGVEQWRRNVAGAELEDGPPELPPELQDLSQVNPSHDAQAKALLVGHLRKAGNKGRDHVAYWRSLEPEWTRRVIRELANYKLPDGKPYPIPFSVELLQSPEINTAGGAPLFQRGETPRSLQSLTHDQRGELAFLRFLGAEELMTEIWPLAYRYFHRGKGKPVPPDLVGGPTFGSPVWDNESKRFVKSFMMNTDAYRRYQAAGSPS